jgi:hypothetical protein
VREQPLSGSGRHPADDCRAHDDLVADDADRPPDPSDDDGVDGLGAAAHP